MVDVGGVDVVGSTEVDRIVFKYKNDASRGGGRAGSCKRVDFLGFWVSTNDDYDRTRMTRIKRIHTDF